MKNRKDEKDPKNSRSFFEKRNADAGTEKNRPDSGNGTDLPDGGDETLRGGNGSEGMKWEENGRGDENGHDRDGGACGRAENDKASEASDDKAETASAGDSGLDGAQEPSVDEKINALNNRYLRVCADFDNFRRRSRQEKESRYDDGVMDALRELMPVVDSMDAAVKASEKWRGTEHGKEFADGMDLIMQQWTEGLSRLGVTEIPGEGSCFDPNVHQVVAHVEDETLKENTVLEVYRKGYAKGNRVVRHSMVKVAN